MVDIPEDYKYAQTHEWVSRQADSRVVTIGISKFAEQQLGDLVFVELPSVGIKVAAGDELCVLESVKTAADVFSPLSGTIVAINEDLDEAPGLVNSDPYQDGWLYKLELKDEAEYKELYDAAAYSTYLEEIDDLGA